MMWQTTIDRRLILGALSALIFFGVIYFMVTGFHRPTVTYYAERWPFVVLVAAILMTPNLFSDQWLRSGSRADPWIWLPVVGAVLATTVSSFEYLDDVVADDTRAYHRFGVYASVVLFGLALRDFIAHADRHVFSMFCVAFGVLHLIFLTLSLASMPPQLLPGSSGLDWPPYHSNIRHLAHHGMISACSGLSLLLLDRRLRLLGGVIFLASVFGLVFFGQRGGVLGLMAFVMVASLLLPLWRRRILGAFVLVGLLALSLTMAASRLGFNPPVGKNLVERVATGNPDRLTSGRTEIWAAVAAESLNKPLTGYGPEGYLTSGCCRFVTVIQPHSTFFQLLIEFGLVGLAAVVFVLIRGFRGAVSQLWSSRYTESAQLETALIFSMIGGTLAFSTVDGIHYHFVPLLTFAAVCALFFGLQAQKAAVSCPG